MKSEQFKTALDKSFNLGYEQGLSNLKQIGERPNGKFLAKKLLGNYCNGDATFLRNMYMAGRWARHREVNLFNTMKYSDRVELDKGI